MSQFSSPSRIETGIRQVDTILDGGLLPASATLLRGEPGSGKTIFGLHFLAEGVRADDTGLYINLGEPTAYLRDTADSFGLDIDPVNFLTLSPSGEEFRADQTYDLFRSGETENPPLVENIRGEVETVGPDRVVIDPITELRYLTMDDHQFRTQVLALIDFLKSQEATVLLTSQAADSVPDDDLQFLVDTVITLERDQRQRTLDVSKFRGSSSKRGPHTVTISDDGMHVWPQLVPSDHQREFSSEKLSSGVPELDSLLRGGLTTGTVTFLSGPTGVGKTTTGLQFMKEAAGRGQRSVLYSFEENRSTMLERAEAVNIPVKAMIERGTLRIEEVSPDELTIDEFTHYLQQEVEEHGSEIIMIDGVSGYERALRGTGGKETHHLIKIGRYLRNMGVTGLVTNEVHQITGEFRATEQQMSHLADNIIVLRHVEYKGELRKVIGVLKMRTSDYENWLRELNITEHGLTVGEPMSNLRGILTGTPNWQDDE
ncbi:ATPase domain-containing protein [Natrarchaeobaculum sulfurireducens]|uniref:non-specific serine/threonine protein kinase n=1 Tax=Natrarchaeobaculum sulfurireducens TaxID=2044521 RepID=A0A346PKB0_9EURY|nr:ATPase domain-containing protein [Natrarchaeobaculum sulfurireducens]AXR79955.1 RecA-superfamily ATPase implicated in signal transduction [Natrarchaeobaculum sulfurireducens]